MYLWVRALMINLCTYEKWFIHFHSLYCLLHGKMKFAMYLGCLCVWLSVCLCVCITKNVVHSLASIIWRYFNHFFGTIKHSSRTWWFDQYIWFTVGFASLWHNIHVIFNIASGLQFCHVSGLNSCRLMFIVDVLSVILVTSGWVAL